MHPALAQILRYKKPVVAVPAGYAGPGDLTTFDKGWYGLRGISAAYAAPGNNPAIGVQDQAGANALTVNILSSGALDVATVSTWVAAHSVTRIDVVKHFDQSGGGFHIDTTTTSVGTLVLNGQGSLPVVRFASGAEIHGGPTVDLALSQPFTMYAVAKRTSGTSLGVVAGPESVNSSLGYDGSGVAFLFAGSVADFGGGAVTENTFHTLQGMFNGASSKGQWDGNSPSTLSPGTTVSSPFRPAINNSGFPIAMDWVEEGFMTGDQSTFFNAIHSQAHTYWGY